MDCNLELGLQLPSSSTSPSPSPSTTSSTSISMGSNNNAENSKQHQMTIFYNGRICVCDVTEIEARNIISYASRSAERMARSSSIRRANQIMSPTTEHQQLRFDRFYHAKKRVLQQFLEKRQHRIQASSPYHG